MLPVVASAFRRVPEGPSHIANLAQALTVAREFLG